MYKNISLVNMKKLQQYKNIRIAQQFKLLELIY
jgi:hypothetical protein